MEFLVFGAQSTILADKRTHLILVLSDFMLDLIYGVVRLFFSSLSARFKLFEVSLQASVLLLDNLNFLYILLGDSIKQSFLQ